MKKEYYWFAFQSITEPTGVVIVEAEDFREAKDKAITIYVENSNKFVNSVIIYKVLEPELEVNKWYSAKELRELEYQSTKNRVGCIKTLVS